ncbi:MAG: nitrite transporter NirC [Gammaproteobacteria bacterium]|nr:nitrite transporter NirC [Gammaproteobacteria bacterium]
MYTETLDQFAKIATSKANIIQKSPLSFLIGSIMAGAYVGLGVILIFTLAGMVPQEYSVLIMGASFGIALMLVVFAGSELFTGHTMYMSIGRIRNVIKTVDVVKAWFITWMGNLLGCIALAYLYYLGDGALMKSSGEVLLKVAEYKMNSSAGELVARGILCNWLVCLAIWMSYRVKGDSAKAIVIFWCLFAFIASGYEHSIANMTLFSLALLAEHSEAISLAGMAHNLLWVTLGNTIAGVFFMAYGYTLANPWPTK